MKFGVAANSALAGALALAGVFTGCVVAGSASASVVFMPGNNPQSDEQNILFNGGSGTTVLGHTNQSGTVVDFTSMTGETLLTTSNGQAKITTQNSNGNVTDVTVSVPGFTFTDFIVDLHDLESDATITVTANDGTFMDTLSPNNGEGENFITILAQNGETISSIDFSSPEGSFEQPRISGLAAVPEASTWAMMLVGFAGLGFAGYRKAKTARTAFSAA